MSGGPAENKGGRGSSQPPTHRPDVVKLAEELGVDLTVVNGTGKGKTITLGDVRTAARERERETSSGASDSDSEE